MVSISGKYKQPAKKSKAELRESITEIESKPSNTHEQLVSEVDRVKSEFAEKAEPRTDPVLVDQTQSGGSIEFTIGELGVCKTLFHKHYEADLERTVSHTNRKALESVRDKFVAKYNES